ncbi:TetR/AcrR family transcriptional regulator [Pseudohaliea sp.]|uniref:TetR/AcrR family transcriptional regulator n=1 Tax=Pseudohaliea sp. TaxID=2740289 RepID=UPI0032EC99E6
MKLEPPEKKRPPRRRSTARTGETRDEILTAALQQFAEYGFHGASLREISKRSGVPLSALHYHYGSKDGLFFAAVGQVFARLSEARLERLTALRRTETPLALEQLLEAFIRPTIELASAPEGPSFMRLQSRVYAENAPLSDQLTKLVLDATHPFRAALEEIMPEVPDAIRYRGYRIMVSSLSGVPVDPMYEQLAKRAALPRRKRDIEALIDLLVSYHAAGFRSLQQSAAAS